MTIGHERASLFLEGGRGSRREIVSPEGVRLAVELADWGERAAAFALDLFFWACASVLILVVLLLLVVTSRDYIVIATLMLFVSFLVRNLYFIHFELLWQGATPGKRAMRLRVIDRRGGPLLPQAVIARNLTREMEVFLPFGLLQTMGHGGSPWETLALAAWLVAFAVLPFCTGDRMRAGDLIGGTIVIAMPRRVLLGDLVERSASYAFTPQHLSAYGAFELQILEELLRHPDAPGAAAVRRDVSDRICRRIGWEQPVPEPETDRFLRDFYAAERAYLEHEQLFGKPRADKNERGGRAG